MIRDKRKMDEITLIQSAQEGDTEAFKFLFKKNKRRVFGLAYQYTKNIEDAEDILQNTFIKAYGSLRNYSIQDHSSFSSWLHRISINCSIDHLRKTKRQRDNITPGGDIMDASAPDNTSNPDKFQQRKEVRECVEHALNTLSKRQRMIFILKHYQEFSIKEIAEYMDCSEGSIKKQLFRIVSVMKKHLRRYMPEDRYEMQNT